MSMKIAMTGGGSGGHITPILAVAHELKQLYPDVQIIYIGEKGDALLDIPSNDPNIDQVYTVSAGKLRRYADEGWRQLLDIRTQSLNVRDLFRTVHGLAQSYRLFRRLKPDVLFTRGGFVSVPVAFGAYLNHVPYITHDSDGTPSLANRMIAKWATMHAVTMPPEFYPYPATRTRQLGVPLSSLFVPVSLELQRRYKDELHMGNYSQIIFVTGGGNGARALNKIVVANAKFLLSKYPDLAIVHLAGRGHLADTQLAYDILDLKSARKRVVVLDFTRDLYRYSGAADVIVARGGATNIAEFATQRKACVIIPPPQLSWNVKDAKALSTRHAVEYLSEDQAEQPERLGHVVAELLADETKRQQLSDVLGEISRPDAAVLLAESLVEIVNRSGQGSVRQA